MAIRATPERTARTRCEYSHLFRMRGQSLSTRVWQRTATGTWMPVVILALSFDLGSNLNGCPSWRLRPAWVFGAAARTVCGYRMDRATRSRSHRVALWAL